MNTTSSEPQPQVSVIVPCYNQAHFVGQAIDSVLNQSFKDFELIVVDDGSNDNAKEVVGRYRDVTYIRQTNLGVSAARNRGLADSNGRYLVFLDADDRLLPEALEIGVRNLNDHPDCAFVWGHSRHIAEDGSSVKSRPKPFIEQDHYRELLRTNYIRTPAEVMYRRTIFDEIGNFDPSLAGGEDYDLNLRIACRFPVFCHGEIINEYRVNQAGATLNTVPMLKGTLTALRHQRRFVRGNREFEEAYQAGVRSWKEYLGPRLANEVLDKFKIRGQREEAFRGLLVLLQCYPLGFLRLASGKFLRTLSATRS